MRTRTSALVGTSVELVERTPKPYETPETCCGKGANSEALLPSGRTSARYSPCPSNLKLVCRGAPGTLRSFSDAKTTRKPPGGMFVAGKRHLVGLFVASVSDQSSRFAVVLPKF